MMSTEQKDFLSKNSGMSEEDIAEVELRNKQLADENSLRERKNIDEPKDEAESAEVEEAEKSESEPERGRGCRTKRAGGRTCGRGSCRSRSG